jgi:acylphosphatase
LVEGLVQGVAFRDATRREAARIGGLRGYVRNLNDGRVEVVAEGDPGKLESLRSFLERGPLFARVERVVECPPDPGDRLREFEIRH